MSTDSKPPRKGTLVRYTPTGESHRVVRVEGNLCWCDYGGEVMPFIWRFHDGAINSLHEWDGKDTARSHHEG